MRMARIFAVLLLTSFLNSNIVTLQIQENNNLNSSNNNNDEGKENISTNENIIPNQKISYYFVTLTISLIDLYTNDPIANGEIIVFNETLSVSGLTNNSGIFSISIEAGWYQFNISALNYNNFTSAISDVFSMTNNFNFALLPINGIGIISSNHVLENDNYNLLYWSINSTAEIYNYLIYLDSSLIKSTIDSLVILDPLNAGIYNITVEMNTSLGYYRDQINLFVIGITFSNPLNGSIVNGGLVPIQFDYSVNDPDNPITFNSIKASVNGTQYIDSTRAEIRSIILPLFLNGSFSLNFKFSFDSLGELSYSLLIISQNVIPALEVSLGDYWIYSIREIESNTFIGTHSQLNIEVSDIIDPLTVNLSLSYTRYDLITEEFIDLMKGWYIVSSINGFIMNSGGNLSLPIDTAFIIFSGLNLGFIDYSIFNTFDMVTKKFSEGSWNGIKTWIMKPDVPFPPSVTWIEHIDQSTGIILYLSYYMHSLQMNEIELVRSNYLPEIPTLISNILTIEEGDQKKLLSWNVNGSGEYRIFKNNILDKQGYWSVGETIDYNLTGLSEGNYNITAVFINNNGLSTVYRTDLHVLHPNAPVVIRNPGINSNFDKDANIISWNISDDSSGTYIIFKNGTNVESGSWNPNDIIKYNFQSFNAGNYNITIKVTDETGLSTFDTIIFNITEEPSTVTITTTEISTSTYTKTDISNKTSEGFSLFFVALSLVALIGVKSKRK